MVTPMPMTKEQFERELADIDEKFGVSNAREWTLREKEPEPEPQQPSAGLANAIAALRAEFEIKIEEHRNFTQELLELCAADFAKQWTGEVDNLAKIVTTELRNHPRARGMLADHPARSRRYAASWREPVRWSTNSHAKSNGSAARRRLPVPVSSHS